MHAQSDNNTEYDSTNRSGSTQLSQMNTPVFGPARDSIPEPTTTYGPASDDAETLNAEADFVVSDD